MLVLPSSFQNNALRMRTFAVAVNPNVVQGLLGSGLGPRFEDIFVSMSEVDSAKNPIGV